MLKTIAMIFSCFLLLSGCATTSTLPPQATNKVVTAEEKKQKVIASKTYLQRMQRLRDIAQPILKRNVPICDEFVVPTLGFKAQNRYTKKDEVQREIDTELFGPGDGYQVYFVTKGSPADVAGLQAGDEITSVNGQKIDPQNNTDEAIIACFGQLVPGKPVKITYLRGGVSRETDLLPENVCKSVVDVIPIDPINALSNGRDIGVTYGMMRFAEDDRDLATVFSHELAHNLMAHREAMMKNAKAGGFVGVIFDIAAMAVGVNTGGAFTRMGMDAGAGANGQEFEREADYVGLYLLAQSGYPLEGAPDFWRKLAAEYPASVEKSLQGSHPSSPERYTAMEEAIKEIKEKMAAGKPLLPEVRKKAKSKEAATPNESGNNTSIPGF